LFFLDAAQAANRELTNSVFIFNSSANDIGKFLESPTEVCTQIQPPLGIIKEPDKLTLETLGIDWLDVVVNSRLLICLSPKADYRYLICLTDRLSHINCLFSNRITDT